ncbi:MAG TPA: serine/threonine protein kinase [Streptosporangiaceae bacterium]
MPAASDFLLAGRYELNHRIAAGGFGEVWRATDVLLGRPVAVKLLHPEYSRNPETLARFRAEARHAGALSHENIARVYDYGEPDPPRPPFLVMELIDGSSLADVLASGPVAPARAMDIVAQTASSLQVAHQAGLIHRDIKPANVLLSHGDLVKITDFGISHAAGSAPVTSTGMVVGTVAYLAPERVRGSSATAASDLYSLGVVAYECLVGAPPYLGIGVELAVAHRDQPMPPLPAAVPAGVAALVGELMAKDPAARPGSAADVARRAGLLRDGLLHDGVTVADVGPAAGLPDDGTDQPTLTLAPTALAPAPLASERPRRRSGRGRRLAIFAAIAAALAAILLAGTLLTSPDGPSALNHPGASPSSTLPSSTPAAARLVNVSGSSLTGQPVSAAVSRLRQLGLVPRVLWRPSSQQRPGTVLSVSPDGQLPVGSTVTVTGALPPQGGKPGGHRKGHKHDHSDG